VPFTIPAPEQYQRFVSLIRRAAPRFPVEHESELQHNRGTAGRALNVLMTLLDGLGIEVPTALGAAGGVGTSNSAEDAANSLVDTAITTGAERMLGGGGAMAGPFVGGGLMLARGANQSLQRSDAMVHYLLGTGGFTNTLSRLCVLAMREPFPYTRMPTPVVPDYVRRTGDIFSPSRRRSYLAGYNAAAGVIREIDSLRPTSGDCYSKQCLIHIGLHTGFTGRYAQFNWRLRLASERYIVQHILALNLRERATQLRHWANAP